MGGRKDGPPVLLATVDYEVHAEKQSKRSENKVLSSFDSRKEVTINLQIE
jgi:hypothetical protein